MSLPVTNLDDRTFQDIVDEAKRLIPLYCPTWTNQELSDPGMALVELFAWMSEMVMYRLNQVPDVFYTRMLNLVGFEPYAPQAATADLTFWLAPGDFEAVVIPERTEVATAGDSPYVFATTRDLHLRPPTLHAALTATDRGFEDRWEELASDHSTVTCFGSSSPAPGDCLLLGFAGSLAGHAIELDVEVASEGVGADSDDAPLQWEVWGDEHWIPATVHQDSTGGLCRSGAVVVLIPPVHEELLQGQVRAFWLRARVLAPRPGQPPYLASPGIRSLSASTVGGTVLAEHSQTMLGELLGISDGSPDQRYQVRAFPVLPRSEGETVRIFSEGDAYAWEEVEDFLRSGPDDRHFVWDSSSGEIRFGPQIRYPDGSVRQHGAVPAAGAQVTVSEYRHGGGAGGNVGAGTLRVARSAVPWVDRVENLRSAEGGVDAESIENAKVRAANSLRRGQQAVTLDDYARLALEADPGIARARCLPPSQSGHPIRLLLVPDVDQPAEARLLDSFALSSQTIERVLGHLDERRILGAEVEVGTPYYQGVTVAALLQELPGRPQAVVQQRALDALYRYLDPLVGGGDGHGWPFDATLDVGSIYRLLAPVEGVERVEEVVLFEFDLRNGQRHGRGVEALSLAPDSLFLGAHHQVVMR